VLDFHPIWITRFPELGFDPKPIELARVHDGDPSGIQGRGLNVKRRAARVA
jgi:hypothetical protein